MALGRAGDNLGERDVRAVQVAAAGRAGRPVLPYLALLGGVLSVGVSAILVRWAQAPGAVTAFYRMVIATAIVAGPALSRVRRFDARHRPGIGLALAAGAFLGIDMALWASGVMLAGATNPTLLANTAPLWVGLGALVLFRERLNRTFWLGIALALVGVALVIGTDSLRSESFGLGSLLGLVAGLFYAGYFLATQRGRETLDPVSYLGIVCASASVCLLVGVLALGQPLSGYTLRTYALFLALGIVPQVFGYLCSIYALGHLPASIVAPTMLGQPVVTAILAVVLLGERLAVEQVAGASAVLAGVYAVHFSRRR